MESKTGMSGITHQSIEEELQHLQQHSNLHKQEIKVSPSARFSNSGVDTGRAGGARICQP